MKTLFTICFVLVSMQVFSQGQMQKESAGNIAFASTQVMQLAAAIPADKYAWAPGPGVRSVSEVCAHMISANYMFGSKLGGKIPADVKMETLEKDLKTKEAVAAELKRSFEFAINAVKNTKDESLPTKIELPFPGEYTSMSAILILVGHSNEHLGQLIAYARMNQVVPPWSK